MKNIVALKNSRLLIIVLLLMGGLSYFGYAKIVNAPCPEYPAKIVDAPEYIRTVWPPPESEIRFACYVGCYIKKYPTVLSPHLDSCVNVYIVPTKKFLDIELNTGKENSPFEDRVSLYIDGKQISKTLTRPMGALPLDGNTNNLEAWYWFGSRILLFPGDHNAKVVVELKNGKVLEYEWHFKIRW